jgi:hypothetical protein
LPQRHLPDIQQQKGYSWLFFHTNSTWITGLLTTILVVGIGGSFYALYYQFGNDFTPDSIAGYAFAITGTSFTLLATFLYTLRRRSHKLAMGQLNAALNWHVFFAIMGISFLFMHSFGNFNAKTGTYALYSLIALLISGFVGRALNNIMPWLIAREVDKIFTDQGEDRVETIARNLQTQLNLSQPPPSWPPAIPTHSYPTSWGQAPPRNFHADRQPASMPWDMAFIASDSVPGSSISEEDIRIFMSNKHGAPMKAGILSSQARQQIAEIRKAERALQREQFYRFIIHYWRVFHIALALLTAGMIIWHLVYVGQLLLKAYMHHA